tara:strand:+ start:195 stop:467 length:273 start_codon:yes stop_codon:yes gene_type:complete
MKQIRKKRSKNYNEEVLNKFDRSLKRDKSNDIIQSNFLLKNKIQYNDLLFDFLNSRIRDLFSDFIVKMDKKDEKLFIEGLNRKIKIRKMF